MKDPGLSTENDGQSVAAIWYHGAEGGLLLQANGQRTFTLSARYHGDRDEFWIEERIGDELVASHNCRHIAVIYWVATEGAQ